MNIKLHMLIELLNRRYFTVIQVYLNKPFNKSDHLIN